LAAHVFAVLVPFQDGDAGIKTVSVGCITTTLESDCLKGRNDAR
jgi:hypothetical protein